MLELHLAHGVPVLQPRKHRVNETGLDIVKQSTLTPVVAPLAASDPTVPWLRYLRRPYHPPRAIILELPYVKQRVPIDDQVGILGLGEGYLRQPTIGT